MKKIAGLLLILVLSIGILGGCTNTKNTEKTGQAIDKSKIKSNGNEKINIKVVSPEGAPTLSMIKMFKEKPVIGENVEIDYENIKSPDVLSSKLMANEADIAIVPTNLAATIYNKGLPYRLVASNVWGSLYLSSVEDIKTFDDLKGKEIYTMGRGLTPDIVFRYLLEQNGIDPEKDVSLKYLTGGTELASSLIAGESKTSLIPEPVLSKVLMKKKDIKVVLDIQEEWSKATKMENGYPQASLIIKSDIIENHPEVVEAFLKEFKSSINWANENPTQAGNYSEELETELNAKVVESGIERTNIKYVDALNAKESIKAYFNILMDYSPDLLGGKLPDEEFYYTK
ncbi:sulfonate/nitrate ABC transport system, substrate-binding protein [Gottschalkia acidurici 9a]|uniref:Sulfonate/nitrate ABC transport system, substrate-binding protein n=1 Tax=Gottschalkia acidurici (strain ATCC 7906 / DSM 604 / BCRC 14475 / CIP 104303 / KCTC 5404 / NCIMB 10678 / 9a) TaxID=1128398 RepID=K0AXE8_GOTA9|nr:MqnA/MqnD/SBP family protein [Gottschalkia acidurici]AFS77437.1 sulfonate/nitrate ABC transport system, substrate-binding protein [Gottschalkia acidurici 9a]